MSVTSYCSVCLCYSKFFFFLYGLFYHGALKLNISTLFATSFLITSVQFMLPTELRFQEVGSQWLLGVYHIRSYVADLWKTT